MILNNNKIIVYTPFKVGSTSLVKTLKFNNKFKEAYMNSDLEILQKQYESYAKIVFKGHTIPLSDNFLKNNNKFDTIITMVRKPTEIYMSSYFQDIVSPGYEYYIGDKKKVLTTPTSKLINHFLSFNWNKFNQCSFNYNFNQIKKNTNIDLWREDFNKKLGFSIYKSKKNQIKNVAIITIDTLNKNRKFLKFMNLIGVEKANALAVNTGVDKWYHEKYLDFKNQMPKDFFNRYREEDKRILDKFYK